jgi:hypothetical protein
MNIRKHKALWLVLTALLVVVCRCDGSRFNLTTQDNQTIACASYIEATSSIQSGKQCIIPCPGYGVPYDITTDADIQNFTLAELSAKVCNPQQANIPEPVASSTDEPTEEPTAPPTDPATDPAPLKPYLTGAALSCNRTQRFVNFAIDPAVTDLNPAGLSVTFNNTPVNCTPIANAQPSVLSCSYPASMTFPIQVLVDLNGVTINNFTFDGGICTSEPKPKPAETEDPVSTPDCTTPPFPESCK